MADDPGDLGRIPVAALLLEGAVVVAANEATVRVTSRPMDELVGSTLVALVAESEQGSLQRWLDGDDGAHGEWVGLLGRERDGLPASVAISVGPIGDAGTRLALVRDASEATMFERVAYHAGQSILMLAADGTLKRRLWGRLDTVGDEDISGDNMLARLHPEDLASVMEGAAWLLGGPDRRLRTTVRARGHADADNWQFLAVDVVSALDDPQLGAYVAFLNLLDEEVPTGALGRSVGTSLADAIPLGVVLADQHGRPIYVNRMAVDLLVPGGGGSPEGFVLAGAATGRDAPWFDELPRASRHAIAAAVQRSASGEGSDAIVIEGPNGWLRLRVRHDRLGDAATPLALVTLEEVEAPPAVGAGVGADAVPADVVPADAVPAAGATDDARPDDTVGASLAVLGRHAGLVALGARLGSDARAACAVAVVAAGGGADDGVLDTAAGVLGRLDIPPSLAFRLSGHELVAAWIGDDVPASGLAAILAALDADSLPSSITVGGAEAATDRTPDAEHAAADLVAAAWAAATDGG